MNNDYIFWTFSAAAQSVSAFVVTIIAPEKYQQAVCIEALG